MNKKTIVQVMGMRSTKYGGLERYMYNVSKRLSEHGYKSYLIYESKPTSEEYMQDLYSVGTEVIVKKSRGIHIFTFTLFLIYFTIIKRPLVIHAHFDPAGYAGLFIAKLLSVPKRVKSAHSMMGPSQRSIKTKLLKRFMYLCATDIFTVSNAIRNEYVSALSINGNLHNKISTHYLGVSDKKITSDCFAKYNMINDDKIIITSVAFHDKIKGVDILLDALSILKYRYKFTDFICLQIGGGDDEQTRNFKLLAENLHINDNIRWMGIQNTVPEILSISNIYIQPSRSEGIPLALMEASMQSLPLIGTNVGGIPEIIDHKYNGYLVETAEDIAKAIYELSNDKITRGKLGANARDKATKIFSMETSVNNLVDFYLT